MATPNKYFQDRFILLLLSSNVVLAFGTVILVLSRLASGHGNSYIVQYRASLGINAFKTGSIADLLSFVVFALLILIAVVMLSLRMYNVKRSLAVTMLSIGILLLVLAIIVSNALLVLH